LHLVNVGFLDVWNFGNSWVWETLQSRDLEVGNFWITEFMNLRMATLRIFNVSRFVVLEFMVFGIWGNWKFWTLGFWGRWGFSLFGKFWLRRFCQEFGNLGILEFEALEVLRSCNLGMYEFGFMELVGIREIEKLSPAELGEPRCATY